MSIRVEERSSRPVAITFVAGLCLAGMAVVSGAVVAEQCTAQIRAKNNSPNHKIKIDKLSTASGPIYVYSARSPSNPHRVLDNTGESETWTIELDTLLDAETGANCMADHRVKVDLIRDNHRCDDIKFPYSGQEPSNADGSFVNSSEGGAIFKLGDLQKAYEDCLNDKDCNCDGPQDK